ncbi:hypothetical protein R1sor_012941 [Riccia sorocarpa]|uniref:Uncharacterized protein n=1 Tax=Riccia sorocarpa TaxID=122646 RepID=A0ABD3I578_9MARC
MEFPPEDAEELIDLTVSKIVETAEEGQSSKHNSAAPASTTIEVYRPPGALQTLDDARGFVTLEEMSLLEPDKYSSDAKNAFAETEVVWDAERGELIAERERLRSELEEAQFREEVLRQERWQAQEEAMQAEMRE